ncbi:MAG: hypothetical protein M1828_006122 [Chrysothrix sp. TS-e1954]|nr:MAG: hypothetical protein M1828_006122 [Chrysothrix sp. TS-e1954]
MASLTSRRAGNAISWTLQYSTRSRSYSLSFSTLERPHRHRSRGDVPQQRHVSTSGRRYQQAATAQPRSTPSSPPMSSTATKVPPSRDAPPQTARSKPANQPSQEPIRDVTQSGLSDMPPASTPEDQRVDWTTSFHGLSTDAFAKEISEVLLQPLEMDDIEIKPDGIIYLPEIKYRRILNRAFGPGGWGLAPRGETIVTAKAVTREYALLAQGRLISISRGEQDYFDSDGIPTATEGCKSNALMRCCKDLGIASELWDPRFIRKFLREKGREIWVEHAVTKKKKKISLRKDDEPKYPFKETKMTGASGAF